MSLKAPGKWDAYNDYVSFRLPPACLLKLSKLCRSLQSLYRPPFVDNPYRLPTPHLYIVLLSRMERIAYVLPCRLSSTQLQRALNPFKLTVKFFFNIYAEEIFEKSKSTYEFFVVYDFQKNLESVSTDKLVNHL